MNHLSETFSFSVLTRDKIKMSGYVFECGFQNFWVNSCAQSQGQYYWIQIPRQLTFELDFSERLYLNVMFKNQSANQYN